MIASKEKSNDLKATVFWITGLSGSGKTTLGRALCARLRTEGEATILVDGDDIRQVFDWQVGDDVYSLAARRRIAQHIHRLCGWLVGQNINVVCCTISAFADIHERNREVFDRYVEVFVDTPMDVLVKRDNKSIYSLARTGKRKNVIGIDLPFEPPARPDLHIENNVDDPGFPNPWVDRILAVSAALK